MSANDVDAEILQPMQRLYLPPRNMDEGQQSQALREYVDALQHFDRTELNVAWTTVRDCHTTRAWPVPASFVMAARQARKATAQPQRAPLAGKLDQNERWTRWLVISRSPLAYEAVKRNVAWSLKCAVLHDGKTAEQIDLRELSSAKASAERTAAAIEAGRPVETKGHKVEFKTADAAIALRMWHAIQVREAETQAEIARVA